MFGTVYRSGVKTGSGTSKAVAGPFSGTYSVLFSHFVNMAVPFVGRGAGHGDRTNDVRGAAVQFPH